MDEEGATQPARDERPQQQSSTSPERTGAPRERDRGRRRHQQNQPRRPEQQQQLPMDELRNLFALFTEHGLTEFEIEREGFRVHLGRNLAPQVLHAPATTQAQTATPATSATPSGSGTQSATVAAETSGAQAEQLPVEESLHIITSPIVGTFYRSPSPDAEPYVRLGSHVNSDTTVCIIEAMKLMNEIQAETNGEIAKIYVENGQPVEFGQPLFGVKK